ncbi:hypothetical protein [Burkholderia cenocepacia]|uniref:hypothetical protein n=1 Tax=Burkholderia cenocepacia TaxID=95486 RepID=UPI0020132864|nr:hypothetical protein [Burkholderia cenocepacia]
MTFTMWNDGIFWGSGVEPLSALQLLKTFYSAEERQSLIARHRQLYDEDAAAFAGLRSTQDALPDRGLGYDARVEKHGEDVVSQQNAPVNAALDKRRETLKAIEKFEAEHPLIKQLSGYAPGIAQAVSKT